MTALFRHVVVTCVTLLDRRLAPCPPAFSQHDEGRRNHGHGHDDIDLRCKVTGYDERGNGSAGEHEGKFSALRHGDREAAGACDVEAEAAAHDEQDPGLDQHQRRCRPEYLERHVGDQFQVKRHADGHEEHAEQQ